MDGNLLYQFLTNFVSRETILAYRDFFSYFNDIREGIGEIINDSIKQYSHLSVVMTTVVFMLLFNHIFNWLFGEEHEFNIFTRMKLSIFRLLRQMPIISGFIEKEIMSARQMLQNGVEENNKNVGYTLTLPKDGLSDKDILSTMKKYQKLQTVNWKEQCSGTVYGAVDDVTELYARKMEVEVVRWVSNGFNGDDNVVGCVTSGGTESIMLACKSSRERARAKGIKFPEMILATSAHVAFHKAADYFGIRTKIVSIDNKTKQIKVSEMKKKITKNTCLLVGSTPPYPHGICDPIEEISKLGEKYDILVHVDACLGGFILMFLEEAGFGDRKPICDFRLSGVTSISCDTHKYGYCPKGSSVILYRNSSIRRYQYFNYVNWPGGIYAAATFAGSKPGALIATTWATLLHFGVNGYADCVRNIIEIADYWRKAITNMADIELMGKSNLSVIAIQSKTLNVHKIGEEMNEIGWHLTHLQFPSGIHIAVTLCHTRPNVKKRFIDDLRVAVERVKKNPNVKKDEMAAIYGTTQKVSDRTIIEDIAKEYLDANLSINHLLKK
ncbi:hypothetical protein SNEBB_010385 [Seison nebaliae]|nr:hypothetical protein SNEBB_010385 [Seison nebaliae]